MVRRSKADAAETRKRILSTAANIFLRNGIAATAISDIMIAAGLTQGGFYRHFDSKEQLVAEAMATGFEEIFANLEAAISGKAPREAVQIMAERYLHQLTAAEDQPRCPLSNLSSELRLADDLVKTAAFQGYSHFVKLFASYLILLDYMDYVGLAESIVAVLVGAVTLSGMTPAEAAAEAILVNAQKAVTLLLDGAATSPALSMAGR